MTVIINTSKLMIILNRAKVSDYVDKTMFFVFKISRCGELIILVNS